MKISNETIKYNLEKHWYGWIGRLVTWNDWALGEAGYGRKWRLTRKGLERACRKRLAKEIRRYNRENQGSIRL